MEGDLVLKVYGNNTFMYEVDKGWVVPEYPPEVTNPPEPEIPPPLLHEVESDVIFLGGILEGSNAIGLSNEMGSYTTDWLEVRPNYTYEIFIPSSNRCRIQFNETLDWNNTVKYMDKYSSNTSALTKQFVTGAKTKYVRINAWVYPASPKREGGNYITIYGQENQ